MGLTPAFDSAPGCQVRLTALQERLAHSGRASNAYQTISPQPWAWRLSLWLAG